MLVSHTIHTLWYLQIIQHVNKPNRWLLLWKIDKIIVSICSYGKFLKQTSMWLYEIRDNRDMTSSVTIDHEKVRDLNMGSRGKSDAGLYFHQNNGALHP